MYDISTPVLSLKGAMIRGPNLAIVSVRKSVSGIYVHMNNLKMMVKFPERIRQKSKRALPKHS